MINEVGNKYGKLTVIKKVPRPDGRPKGAYWLCQCECGNEKIARGADLRAGSVNSCGCLYGKHSIKDETGNRYGKLTVLSQTDNREFGSVKWLCKCDCGAFCEVAGDSLRSGDTQSCGCLVAERSRESNLIDITGQTFGKLTVISLNEELSAEKKAIFWKCLCECGNYTNVKGQSLKAGAVKSCGCLNTNSYGAQQIEKLLKEHNISYAKEYTFPDLKTNAVPLRFDFAIFNNNNKLIQLIEFDGQQHFRPVPQFGGQEAFERIQYNDKRKNEYCERNHIKLVRINYTNTNIKFEDLEVNINELSQQ